MHLHPLEPRTLYTVVTAPNVTVTEGASAAAVTVRIDIPRRTDFNVNYQTIAGSAHANKDFTPAHGVVTIPAGSTSASVSVPLIDNTRFNPPRTFKVRFQVPDHSAKIFSTVTINDNEKAPVLSVAAARYVTPNDLHPNTVSGVFLEQPVNGKRGVDFLLTLSGPSSQKITTDFDFLGNTATAGQDFALHKGRVTFNPGQTQKHIRLYLLPAPKTQEPRQTLTLALTNPFHVTLASGSQNTLITLRGHLDTGKPDPADKPPAPSPVIVV